MEIIASAHARAGLVGNPSDGYFGKTIAFIIRNFSARVMLREAGRTEIHVAVGDRGGEQLLGATMKRFHSYCAARNITLPDRSFAISFASDVPRLVGLAGSSAIVTAAVRALMQFYGVKIPQHELPSLVLSVEKDELGINAGLQDRVIQTYEGIVYMDFARALIESRGFGNYERLRPPKLPPLYVAYDEQAGEASDVPHRDLRERFERGDSQVLAAMRKFADLTDLAKIALMNGAWNELGELIDANFDLRRSIMTIAPRHLRMIETARSAGASAHFCGSGGAICGLVRDADHFKELSGALNEIGCTVIEPRIYES